MLLNNKATSDILNQQNNNNNNNKFIKRHNATRQLRGVCTC